MIFDLIEFYFTKLVLHYQLIFLKNIVFFKKKSEIKKYNLDEESLFIEFEEEFLNG